MDLQSQKPLDCLCNNYSMININPIQQSWSETNRWLDLRSRILIELLYNQFMKPLFAIYMQRVPKIGISENVVFSGPHAPEGHHILSFLLKSSGGSQLTSFTYTLTDYAYQFHPNRFDVTTLSLNQ